MDVSRDSPAGHRPPRLRAPAAAGIPPARKHLRTLLVEDDLRMAQLVNEYLLTCPHETFDVSHAETLAAALELLENRSFDLVLLDLGLPDSRNLDSLLSLHDQTPETPIVVLTGINDEQLARAAVFEGAQDYLLKTEITANLLVRSLRYAVERQQLLTELQALSLRDHLTGLYNGRGFLMLAEQHLRLARRTKRGFTVLYGDLDGLKAINDQLGHGVGDLAITEAGSLLRGTLRESDIVARVGGDEFAAVVIETETDAGPVIRRRLEERLDRRNAENADRHQLAMSLGSAFFDPQDHRQLSELLDLADQSMYEDKQARKGDDALSRPS